ncbi:MAG: hypothetical protein NVS4B3_15480 [Gemmatimonadaceae bacterium]
MYLSTFRMGSMLAFLDTLCTALLQGDGLAIRSLLEHPLARTLPRRVREEALAIARVGRRSFRAPVHTLHFYYQTVQLFGGQSVGHSDASTLNPGAEPVAPGEPARLPPQMELPLRHKTAADRHRTRRGQRR